MNVIYRTIWNPTLQSYVVASELATTKGKRTGSARRLVAPLLVAFGTGLLSAQAGASGYPQTTGPLVLVDGGAAVAAEPAKATDPCPTTPPLSSDEKREENSAECSKKSGTSAEKVWATAGLSALAVALGASLFDGDSGHRKQTASKPLPPTKPAPPTESGVPPLSGLVTAEDTVASGAGTVGHAVAGDNAIVDNQGAVTVDNGAVGVSVSGNGVNVTNTGNTTASGAGSVGTVVAGSDAQIKQEGDTVVGQGATGVQVNGDNATVSNTGQTNASGVGSTGTVVTGSGAQVNQQGTATVESGATGVQVNGDNATVSNTGQTNATGAGSTGTAVTGNGAHINQQGPTNVGAGATGIQVSGSNAIVNTTGDTSASGAGSTGTVVTGSDAQITQEGDTIVDQGATGVQVSGDNAVVSNTGHTNATGAGSTGTAVTGNGAHINQQGATNVSAGATGINVSGNNAIVSTEGNTSASGAGTVGTVVTGSDAQIKQEGTTTVADGATGIQVSGDKAVVENTGAITASGSGTAGMVVAGDSAHVNLTSGTLKVTGGATGVRVTGANSVVNNRDKIQVADVGSIGVIMQGRQSTFDNAGTIEVTNNGTGVSAAGDLGKMRLGGDITVTSIKNDQGVLQGGTGVKVSGNGNVVDIAGNLSLRNEPVVAGVPVESVREGMQGLLVSGDSNTVAIKGAVNSNMQGNLFYNPGPDGVQGSWVGVSVVGNNNRVTVDGGVKVSYDMDRTSPAVQSRGLIVDGKNRVEVSGQSSLVSRSAWSGAASWAHISGGAELLLTKDSVLGLDLQVGGGGSGHAGGALSVTGAGSSAENAGTINIVGVNIAMVSTLEGLAVNTGTINSRLGTRVGAATSAVLFARGGNALNQGNINIVSTAKPFYSSSSPHFPVVWWGNTLYAMAGGRGVEGMIGSVENQGTITLSGAGLYGVATTLGATGRNSGTIHLDGFTPTLDADGKVIDKTDTPPDSGLTYLRGAGMLSNGAASSVINTGAIQVVNAGSGMLAMGAGATALNSGTITLAADPGISNDGTKRQLIGMTAMSGGTAINDTTGKIVISGSAAAIGVPFYRDSTSVIINRGLVCVGDAVTCTDAPTYNLTDSNSPPTYGDGDVLSAPTQALVLPTVVQVAGNVTSAGGLSGGAINVLSGGTLTNASTGTIANGINLFGGTFSNQGVTSGAVTMTSGSVFRNTGEVKQAGTAILIASSVTASNAATGTWSMPIRFSGASSFTNDGRVTSFLDGRGTSMVVNNGIMEGAGVYMYATDTASVVNNGTVTRNIANASVIGVTNSAKAVNGPTGVINVGAVGTRLTNMVGMQLEAAATANAMVINQGTINVNANNSYAFSKLGANGRIINTGTVNFANGVTGSSLVRQPGVTPETVLPDGVLPAAPAASMIRGYTIGTNADGSAGRLRINNAVLDDVAVNTDFTTGTAATAVTFKDVVQGSNIQGAENIRSDSVVWRAEGKNNDSGNVDVTMTKNDYAKVISESNLQGVASALDASYTNNALFNSLNVGSVAELNNALTQMSGNLANSVAGEARLLSNRYTMLADATPALDDGLSFNVVARGDKRAELNSSTRYDMTSLSKRMSLAGNRSLEFAYGIARLSGSRSGQSGATGVSGGHSQFFGLKHAVPLVGKDTSWTNALRYDVHNLSGGRRISFGEVGKIASASLRQQHLEYRSQAAKSFHLNPGLTLTPFAGMKVRHSANSGYSETGAGEYNLRVSGSAATAVDALAGFKLGYAGKNGWSGSATFEGGPNLSYANKAPMASLAGAAGQRFAVNDGRAGGGLNGQATLGINFATEKATLAADAYYWREDRMSDQGFRLNFAHKF